MVKIVQFPALPVPRIQRPSLLITLVKRGAETTEHLRESNVGFPVPIVECRIVYHRLTLTIKARITTPQIAMH